MSIKSLIQIFILFLIILILGGVYYEYFETKKNVVEEINSSNIENQKRVEELEQELNDLKLKNQDLKTKIEKNNNSLVVKSDEKNGENIQKSKEIIKSEENFISEKKIEVNKKQINSKKKKEIKNLVKDVEYNSVDQKGNRFHLLATSAQSNIENNDILDLNNVRGKITSEIRDTIYIVSDFAEYNSVNLNSKFYENVVINYQDKEITCINFDINMETNKAIAYNNVIITDPKSIMKAGIVEFDLKTKNININPEVATAEINVITN
tara:strand:+ start:2736 stop:3533 length:798 start_codon:yes stop_codon:yes gene_type:complete